MRLSNTADSHMWRIYTVHSDRVLLLTCKQQDVQGMVYKSWEGCVLGEASEELVLLYNCDLHRFKMEINN